MEDIVYRDVKQPERLKSAELEGEDWAVLGRDQGAGVGTDLDGGQGWPTQLHVMYDKERDVTVIQPRGSKNKLGPYKLSGLVKPLDVRSHFLAEFGPKEAADNEETPLAGSASEVVGNEVSPEPIVQDQKGADE